MKLLGALVGGAIATAIVADAVFSPPRHYNRYRYNYGGAYNRRAVFVVRFRWPGPSGSACSASEPTLPLAGPCPSHSASAPILPL